MNTRTLIVPSRWALHVSASSTLRVMIVRFAVSAVAAVSGLFLLGLAFYGEPAVYLRQARDQWDALLDRPPADQPLAERPADERSAVGRPAGGNLADDRAAGPGSAPAADPAAERAAQLQREVARLREQLAVREQATAALEAAPPADDADAQRAAKLQQEVTHLREQLAARQQAAAIDAPAHDAPVASAPVQPPAAQPTSAQPTLAQPTGAQPNGAGADSGASGIAPGMASGLVQNPSAAAPLPVPPIPTPPPDQQAAASQPSLPQASAMPEAVQQSSPAPEQVTKPPGFGVTSRAGAHDADQSRSQAAVSSEAARPQQPAPRVVEIPERHVAATERSARTEPIRLPPPAPARPSAIQRPVPAPPALPQLASRGDDEDDAQSVLARLRQGSEPPAQTAPLQELPPSAPSPSLHRLIAARAALAGGRVEDARRLLQEAQLQLVFRPVTTDGDPTPAAGRGAADVAHALEALSANDIPLGQRYIGVAVDELSGRQIAPPVQETDRRGSGYAPAYPPR